MIRRCRRKFLGFLLVTLSIWILHKVYTFSQNNFSNAFKSSVIQDKNVFPFKLHLTGESSIAVSDCISIQVAIISVGHKSNHDLIVLLKSILASRKAKLHLHLIVNHESKSVLRHLFQTWNVHNLVVSFYSSEKIENEVSWIPNRHYSGIYGLLKLVLPKVLPDHIARVIVLDTDIVFTNAIDELWKLFKNFSDHQAIGLVENQSNWYLGTVYENYTFWPALGRGFNTGVMLLDCSKLKLVDWENIWKTVTYEELKSFEATVLADQDIINAVIKRHSYLVHKIPCIWNLQLTENMEPELCYNKYKTDVNVVHWNLIKSMPDKYKPVHVTLFKDLRQRFVEMNGALLRRSATVCEDITEISDYILADARPESDVCSKFVLRNGNPHRTHLHYFPYQNERFKDDVSIIVHLSIDRLQMLEFLCRNWDGPISASVFLSDAETLKFELFVSSSSVLSKRENIAYHLVYQNSVEDVYPTNLLRNIALQQSDTDFVFLYDVDFIPMPNMYSYILSHLSDDLHTNLTAFILPAFESLWYKKGIPATKADLLEALQTGTLKTFREIIWPQGHAATNFSKWYLAEKPYRVQWEKDFEPYVVVSRFHCPLYDKRFVGYGWNKISHIMELDAMGFKFVVLPHGFITHVPHLPSMDLMKYRTLPTYRKCINDLKISFLENLISKYGIKPEKYSSFLDAA